MGSGVSSLPESFTEEELKTVCSERCNDSYLYNAVFNNHMVFDSLKEENGLIDRSRFLEICNDSCEQEVLRLFLGFCDGNMDVDTYTKLCYHTKMLSKKHLTRQDAIDLFNSFRKLKPRLNYSVFRYEIVPAIAEKRGCKVRDLIVKLSRVEIPDNPKTIKAYGSFVNDEDEEKEKDDAASQSPDYILRMLAAVRIQSMRRAWTARDVSVKLKELHRLESQLIEHMSSSKSVSSIADVNLEQMCKEVFLGFSPCGEMTRREFIRFCHDTEIIPLGTRAPTPVSDIIDSSGNSHKEIPFTAKQAKFIFDKIVAKFFDPVNNVYAEGVLHGKRILFEVFRDVALVDIASEKNVTLDEVVDLVCGHSSMHARRRYNSVAGVDIVSSILKSNSGSGDDPTA